MTIESLRVVLVDDHTLVRAGIRSLLEGIAHVVVVAEADNGGDAVELVRKHSPDLVVMDITMGGLNGIDATAEILAYVPGARVLILSMHSAEEFVRRALRAGARGYLVKDSATVELRLAVEALARGDTYICSRVARSLAMGVADHGARGGSSLESLTARQRQVLLLIALGKSTRDVAEALDLSIKTVETHRAALMARLGIFDIAGLVKFAARCHLISLDDPPS